MESHRRAEAHVDAGQLRLARDAFLGCAAASCGGLLSQQCLAGLQHLEEDTPSVIFVVTDARGALLVDVLVRMDGDELGRRADGRSIDVDPGLHLFELSTESNGTSSERLLILQGQRNRVVNVQLKPTSAASPATLPAPRAGDPSPAPAEQPTASLVSASTRPLAPRAPAERRADTGSQKASPLLAYVLGGAGLTAVGSSLLLAHWAHEDNLRLDQCAPNCSQDSVDHVGNMYIAADITLGAGIAALGAATWLYFTRPEQQGNSVDRAYRLDIQPKPSGAFVTVGRGF